MSEEQRTQVWFEERAGKITASNFKHVLDFTAKGLPSTARMKYMRLLAAERLSGKPKKSVDSKAMEWGREIEEAARQLFEMRTGRFVDLVGFAQHPSFSFVGASADGLIDDDGGIEIKCPHSEDVHIETWIKGMPAEHLPQVQGCMWVTGRNTWTFVSCDPNQCEKLQLYIEEVKRDDAYIAELERKVLQFEMELQAMVKQLLEKTA